MRKRRLSILLTALMFLGCLLFMYNPAVAQDDTTVSFSPDPANVYLNGSNSQVVKVWVENVENLYGFDFTITYNAAVASISSFAMGDLLDIDLNSMWCLRKVNNPGSLRLACAQHDPAQPVTGSGVLFTMTFVGNWFAQSPVTFSNAGLSVRTEGGLSWVFPQITNGTINATYNPSIIKPVSVLGGVELQGRAGRGGAVIGLSTGQFVGQGPYSATSTNTAGNNVSFSNVAMDLYRVTTNTPRYLNITAAMNKQIALVGASTTIAPLKLVGGNAVWSDNEINSQDLGLVSGEYGKVSFIADADLNNDGAVDILDLAIVAGNYGKSSEVEYGDWSP